MSEETAKTNAAADEEKAQRKARSERLTQTMWAYICGGIALLSIPVGLEATFIPLGFGILGCVLVWQLMQKGERRRSLIAGAVDLGAIMIWLTYNWPMIRHYLGG
jgi:hypothetical protein